jgi:hypothetical protein
MKHGKIHSKLKNGRKSTRVGLSPLDEHRLRRTLRRAACSETWVDDQIKTLQDNGSDGQSIVYRFYDPKTFPPGGANETAMRWCRFCGRYTPPNSIHLIEHRTSRAGDVHSSTLQCDDCRMGIEAEVYRELHEAGLYLRPTGSMSFVRMRQLLRDRRKGDF